MTVREEIRLGCFAAAGLGITALGAEENAALNAAWSASGKLTRALLELERSNRRLESEGAAREHVYEKLRFSEALLTEGQRISHTGSWLFNIATGTLCWSDEHYRLFGYDTGISQPSFNMATRRFHADDRDRVSSIVHEATREGARFECECRIVLPDGAIRHIRAMGYQAGTGRAGSADYIGISMDITERRQTEALLRKREQEFRTLAENSPDRVIRYDLDCRRVYVNPAYERSRAVDAEVMLHQPLALNWHWGSPADAYEQRRRVIDTKQTEQMVGVWHIPNCKQIHCAIHAVAEPDSNGKVISVLAIIRDTSSLKQAELRLQKSQHLLRQLANHSETVREEERKHLARELHDDLAQYLLALRMKIMTLDFEFGQQHQALAAKTGGMTALVDAGIKVVRNIVTTLRPATLDMGIVAALEWLVEDLTAETGTVCHLTTAVAENWSCEPHVVAFFRITQEALRKVARHARATEVNICLWCQDEVHHLEIEDNSIGFDRNHKKPSSFGLFGMREWALMFGGQLEMRMAPERGTVIHVPIPIHADVASQ